MLSLNKDNFFFFYDDCSCIKLIPDSLEHGYLAVLNDDLDVAAKIFSKIDSPRAKWAKILVSILNGVLEEYPTYFQVRNFLEIDLDLLLRNEKIHYVELLLGALEIILHFLIRIESKRNLTCILYDENGQYFDKIENI